MSGEHRTVYVKHRERHGSSGHGHAQRVVSQEVNRPYDASHVHPHHYAGLHEVRPGDAYGKFDGIFTLKRDDLIIVSARELDLWQGRSRSDQLVMQSLLSRNGKGYDTGDVTPALLNEVGRDDDLIIYRPPVLHVNAEAYSMLSPAVRNTVIRGAFRPASLNEDSTVRSEEHTSELQSQ